MGEIQSNEYVLPIPPALLNAHPEWLGAKVPTPAATTTAKSTTGQSTTARSATPATPTTPRVVPPRTPAAPSDSAGRSASAGSSSGSGSTTTTTAVANTPATPPGKPVAPAVAAAPVDLPVPDGTTISAVTAGKVTSVTPTPPPPAPTPAPGANGVPDASVPTTAVPPATVRLTNTRPPTNTVVVVGTDGATYTYTGVVGAPVVGTRTTAGLNIGTAGPTGITFGIMIPDVDGQVCATPALEAWSVGTPLDVRSLPSVCLPGDLSLTDASLSGAHQNVLVVTDSGAGAAGGDLKNVLGGSQITPTTLNLDPSQTPAEQADAIAKASIVKPAIPARPAIPATATSPAKPARRAVPAVTSNLVVIALGSDNPAAAAVLTAKLPPTQQVLWVIPPLPSGSPAPPAGTQSMAARYAVFSAMHPNVRVDWLSASYASLTTGTVSAPNSSWSSVGAQVVASNVAGYAAAAYGLPTASAAVSKVLAYAEAQLGKPYQWAGSGPASFDCSGLTMAAFAQVGISLAHNADAQFMATKSEAVSEADLQPGDLVFFNGADGTAAAPGHVGIYLGNAQYIAAPDTGGVVSISTLAPGDGFVGASRPLASISLAGDTMTSSGAGLSSLASLSSLSGMLSNASVGPDQSIARAMVDAIWNDSQWAFLDALWVRESGWNPFAINPTSGAYGIPQSLPADKMASVAPDWATNATTQITWGIEYIQATYGSPQAAWAHEVAFNWY